MCDLGASINLIPLTLAKKLGITELKPTTISLQLADRSITYPLGIVEDVLVKVGKLILPADFLVLDMEDDLDVSVILGRPFLATGGVLIDVPMGKLTFRVGNEKEEFDILKSLRKPSLGDTCFSVDVIDSLVQETFIKESYKEPLEACLALSLNEKDENSEIVEYALRLEGDGFRTIKHSVKFEDLGEGKPQPEPSVKKPPQLELKQLPSHLKYTFLGANDTYPVIISAFLSTAEEEKLLRVLRKHITAIAWSISDIKGISPSICMHKILMEENYRPCVQPQRRLNPNMKDVVRNEVLKLLRAGIIYPISNNSWVSPVQVVPKKGGTTVVNGQRLKHYFEGQHVEKLQSISFTS